MTRQWIRSCHLTVEGSGGKIDLSTLRIRFRIEQDTLQSPNVLDATVTNVSKATGKRFIDGEFKKVTLSAAYRENEAVIFEGNIVQSRFGRETPTETYLNLICADGDKAYNFAVVNKTLGAGSTGRDQYKALLESMKPFDIAEGFVTDALDKLKFPRPVVMYGQAKDFLRTLAHSVDSTWSIQNGKLDMVGKSETKKGGTIVLNAATGLIGLPEQTAGGIIVRALINPQIAVTREIKLDNSSIQAAKFDASFFGEVKNAKIPGLDADGLYKVLKIQWHGDTRGNPWYMTMWCLAKSGGGWVPDNLLYYLGKS